MKVYVSVKQAGKRKPVLEKREYLLEDGIDTLRGVLTFFTRTEVEKYNRRDPEACLLYADGEELTDAASQGKVNFGARYGTKDADPEEAVERTMESFRDGLVRVFLNDRELTEPDKPAEIREGDVFTFIRLTFLSGRMW